VIQQTRDREALSLSMKRPRSAQQVSDVDRLIEERDRIDHSLGIADSTLEQAYQTRNEFGRQRATLSSINRRLMQSASTTLTLSVWWVLTIGSIPGVNTLIGKINTRKKRDSLIIAVLLAICIFGLIMFR
jgi:golgi SNAP receptor complex member 1